MPKYKIEKNTVTPPWCLKLNAFNASLLCTSKYYLLMLSVAYKAIPNIFLDSHPHSPLWNIKYKQIKKDGVESFSEKPSIPFFFYLLIKEQKMLEKGWKLLCNFFCQHFCKKVTWFSFTQFNNLISRYRKFLFCSLKQSEKQKIKTSHQPQFFSKFGWESKNLFAVA